MWKLLTILNRFHSFQYKFSKLIISYLIINHYTEHARLEKFQNFKFFVLKFFNNYLITEYARWRRNQHWRHKPYPICWAPWSIRCSPNPGLPPISAGFVWFIYCNTPDLIVNKCKVLMLLLRCLIHKFIK